MDASVLKASSDHCVHMSSIIFQIAVRRSSHTCIKVIDAHMSHGCIPHGMALLIVLTSRLARCNSAHDAIQSIGPLSDTQGAQHAVLTADSRQPAWRVSGHCTFAAVHSAYTHDMGNYHLLARAADNT